MKLKPLARNPNQHTAEGKQALGQSITANGYTEPMVAAADGTILSGNARAEVTAQMLPGAPIIVESDGTRPIVHVRTDIADADDPKARRVIIASNRVQEIDYAPDNALLAEMLDGLQADGEMVGSGYSERELSELLDEVAAQTSLKVSAPVDDFEVETDDVLAPFPYFGGKSRVAGKVWARFGSDVANYVEPFCGSAAVLLQCPYELKVVTLNDKDGFIANFWRAVVGAPDDVAQAADWPVSEIDMFAREVKLVKFREAMTRQLWTDESYFDAKVAGWWVWGVCGTIGALWCAGKGPWTVENGEMVNRHDDGGVIKQLPHLGNAGRGVNRKLPHLGSAGQGVNRKLPHLGDAGRGDVVEQTSAHFRDYMRALQNKLRRARVACGDWARVVTDSVTFRHGLTAVFLDPPYGDGDVEYSAGGNDDKELAHDARQWALEHGNDPQFRIALCGYDDLVMPDGWSLLRWKARKGYQSAANDQSHREVIWFSPHCLKSSENDNA